LDIIKINSEQRSIGTIGKAREHNQTRLDFEIPAKLLDYDKYDIEFEMECGKKFVVHDIKPIDGELRVMMEQHLLEFGKCYMQIVAYELEDDGVITKSPKYISFVEKSINAAQEEVSKNPTLVQQLYVEMDKLRDAVAEHAVLEFDENTLRYENGKLSVRTTNEVSEDNTLPITSAGVAVQVGNIEVLLNTI
jgi:hypothetical protein